MKIYTLEDELIIKSDIKTVWNFFSNSNNLKLITPPSLDLRLTCESKEDIYSGQIIEYTVKPIEFLPIFKLKWLTEITHLEEYKYFIDEQRFGPYKLWHHKHFFIDQGDHVIVKDLVHYALFFDPFSRLSQFYVENQLKKIFKFRQESLSKLFDIYNQQSMILPFV